MAHFYLQVLQLLVLLFILSECRGCSPVTETVSASKEEDAVLSCFNSSVMMDPECYRVKWTKNETYPSQMKVILVRPVTSTFPDASRVKWGADGNGKMSLFLTKSQKSDEGCYICEIWKGWDRILAKSFSLKVKDCGTLKSVKAASSTTVNLSCQVDESGKQRPSDISWTMQKGSNSVFLSSGRFEINGTALTILSVQVNDSGWYRCEYMLGKTRRCVEINLQVQAKDVKISEVPVITTMITQVTSMKGGESSETVTAMVASVITVIAIIAALMGLLVYYRLGTQRVTQQTHMHQADDDIQSYIYDTVDDTLSEVNRNSRSNSMNICQQLPDDSMCTFNH